MVTEIKRLEDVRPGDIYLGPIGGLLGWGVGAGEFFVDGGFRVGTLDVRHIGIVVEASKDLPPGSSRNLKTMQWHSGPLFPEAMPFGEEFMNYPTGVQAAPRLAQAMPGGAEIVDMSYAQHWNSRCAFARLPEDYPGQAEDAAAIARLMVRHGVGYSYGSYAALAAWHWGLRAERLTTWIGRRQEPIGMTWPSGKWSGPMDVEIPVEAICSVFADQAWSLTGKKIFTDGRPHQCVTPSQLATRLLTGLPDVIWGWPSLYPYP